MRVHGIGGQGETQDARTKHLTCHVAGGPRKGSERPACFGDQGLQVRDLV